MPFCKINVHDWIGEKASSIFYIFVTHKNDIPFNIASLPCDLHHKKKNLPVELHYMHIIELLHIQAFYRVAGWFEEIHVQCVVLFCNFRKSVLLFAIKF